MDQFLFDRWQNGATPFDGDVLRPLPCPPDRLRKYMLSEEELREGLSVAVAKLRREYGDAPLVTVDDWHEHDGVVLPERRTTWQEIQNALASKAALYEARNDDTYVHRAFYPVDGAFLLRFDLSDREDSPHREIRGTFDLAGPIRLLKEISANCTEDLRAKLQIENAKHYFDEKYAG